MASNIETQINITINLLNRLREAGKLTDDQLKKISESVSSLNLSSGINKDVSQIIKDLDLLGNKLQFTQRLFVQTSEKTFYRQHLDDLKKVIPEYQKELEKLERWPGRRESLQNLIDNRKKDEDPPARREGLRSIIQQEQAQREYTRILQDEVNKRTEVLQQESNLAYKRASGITEAVQAQKEFIDSMRQGSDVTEKTLKEEIDLRRKALDASLQATRVQQSKQTQSGEIRPNINNRPSVDEKDFVSFFGELPYGERALANLNSKLAEYGATIKNVRSANVDLTNGIRTVNIELSQSAGITKTATLFFDEAGRTVERNQRGFRTFGDSLRRDVGEFLKWTLAATLILGPLQKLNELVQEAVQIEKLLADAQVATGVSTEKLNSIFLESARIAELTGSSVKGVVEGYSLAFTATGSINNAAERAATTQILLKDSMVLSKLAGIEQAKALDILVAGLRQTGRGLAESTQFLDAWVAVSKRANVSIETLATAYSIVGTAASDAGISQDQLNGIIATMAESTGLSAEETANSLRGFISGFGSDTSEQVLGKYGIAVRDLNGNLKEFITLVEEIKAQQDAGILDDRAIQEIANAVGGGFRQGSRVATFFETYSRASDLAKVSSEASGDAAEAFGVQLQTLDTAITRLSNSFTTLAQSIGTKGGLLDLIKDDVVGPLTSFISLLTKLVDGMGKATPAIIALGAALAFLGSQTGTKFLDTQIRGLDSLTMQALNKQGLFSGGLSQTIAPGASNLLWTLLTGSSNGTLPTSTPTIGSILSNLGTGIRGVGGSIDGLFGGRTNLAGVNPIGYIAPSLIAGGAIAEGDYGKAGTSVAGAIVGGLLSAGNPLGIAAGSAMAASFYENFVNYEEDLAKRWQELALTGQEAPKTPEEQVKDLQAQLEDTYSPLGKAIPKIGSSIFGGLQGFYESLFDISGGRLGWQPSSVELTPEDFRTRQARQGEGLTDEQKELIRQLEILNTTLQQESNTGFSSFTSSALTGQEGVPGLGVKDYQNIFTPIANQVSNDLISKVLGQYQVGQATSQQFQESRAVGQGLTNKAQTTALALDLSGISYDAEELTKLLAELQDEESKYLNQIVSDLLTAENQSESTRKSLEELSKTDNADPKTLAFLNKQLEDAEAKIKELQALLQQVYPAAEQGNRIRQAQLLPTIDLGELNTQQSSDVKAKAEELYRNYLEQIQKIYGLTDDDIEKIIADGKESLIQIEKGIFDGTSKIPQEYFKEAIDQLGLSEESSGKTNNSFQLLDLRDRMSSAQLPQLQALYARIVSSIQQNFPQYDIKEEGVGLILKDGFGQMNADMTLLNLAMEELIDVNKQQLNGVYNLPDGATFFVPLTGYDLARSTVANQKGGLGDLFKDFPTGNGAGEITPSVSMEDWLAKRNLTQPNPPQGTGQPSYTTFLPIVQSVVDQTIQNRTGSANTRTPDRSGGILEDWLGKVPPMTTGGFAGLGFLKAISTLFNLTSKAPDITKTSPTEITDKDNVGKVPAFRLNLDIRSNFTVQLDGRTIATTVKNFLLDDLIRNEGSGGGGVTRRFVL